MYREFYNLIEKPFSLTPDPRFIYFTEKHCEALANLVYGIRERKGFLVLSGEVGTGKTTLVNALLDTFERAGVLFAFIFNPLLSKREFFRYLLADLNLRCDVPDKSEALMRLNSLLLARHKQGQITVLVVDEAQNLSAELLEEVRLLTNLETATEKLLQIILVGQPELNLKLNSPNLRQLKQRISVRCSLGPLSLFETKQYIRTRMEIAGLPNQQVFSDPCMGEIFRCSGGIPRLINTICDNALLIGFACDSKTIGLEIIHEIAQDFELSNSHSYLSKKTPSSEELPFPRKGDKGTESAAKHPSLGNSQDDADSFGRFMQFVDSLRHRARQEENI